MIPGRFVSEKPRVRPLPASLRMKGAITGKQYKPLPCACDALPWEICHGCKPQAKWLTARGMS